MDADRRAHLDRILEARRRRGATGAVPMQGGLEDPQPQQQPPPSQAASRPPPPVALPSPARWEASAPRAPSPPRPYKKAAELSDSRSGPPGFGASHSTVAGLGSTDRDDYDGAAAADGAYRADRVGPASARPAPPSDFMARVAHVIRPMGGHGGASGPAPRDLAAAAPLPTPGVPFTVPTSSATPQRLRSGSVTQFGAPAAAASPAPSLALSHGDAAPAGDGLFVRGRFDDFRRNPTQTLDNIASIKPYRSERQLVKRKSLRSASQTSQGGRGSGGGAASARSLSPATRRRLEELPITEPNPFRGQSFERFVMSPSYGAPVEALQILEHARAQIAPAQNHRREPLAQPGFHQRIGDRGPSPGGRQDPVYPRNEALAALMQGDWFHKWTRRKDKIHRRYFWLGGNGTLFWSKAPHANTLISSSLAVHEIVQIETRSEVDAATGRTLYVMTIWTVSRTCQLGTELHEKFDLWYEALKSFSRQARERNQAYFSRHATMQPVQHDPHYAPVAPSD
jgi:hypothetical protein